MALQRQDIQNYLRKDGALPPSAELFELVEKHPYSAILHFIYLRSLQEEDSYKFPAQLHRTAVSTMNRHALLDWAEAPLIPVEVQAAAWKQKQGSESSKARAEAPAELPIEPVKALPAEEDKVHAEVVPAAAPSPSPAPASSPPTPAEPISFPSKPASRTKLSEINLDALPPAVREQVLRSRAIQEQYSKTSGSEAIPQEPKPIPAVEVKPESKKVPEKEDAPASTNTSLEPAGKLEKESTPTPGGQSAAPTSKEVASKPVPPAASKPVPKPASESSMKHDLEPRVANVAQASVKKLSGSKEKAKKAEKKPEAKMPSDPSLSPFANFLMGLQSSVTEDAPPVVPKSERDPAMERAILEQFLQVNPKIKPLRDAPMGENLALKTPNVSGLVTETLANHYYDQGMTEKAIQAYEILKLKVPEKSAIFAARISEMRKTQSSTK
ncbi:hypothetical protein N9N00_03225 [Schleiferiaceae bacterium]|nr:hypothetical protein [Schleiferiaceae bacterium]